MWNFIYKFYKKNDSKKYLNKKKYIYIIQNIRYLEMDPKQEEIEAVNFLEVIFQKEEELYKQYVDPILPKCDLSMKPPPVATKAFLLLLLMLHHKEVEIFSTEYDPEFSSYEVKVTFNDEVTLEGQVYMQQRIIDVSIDPFCNSYMTPFISDNQNERGVINVSDSTAFMP